MSGTGTVRRTATLIALALLGASTMAVAQVPAKPTPPKDTTKQPTSKPRLKISKEAKVSGGEVMLQAKAKVDSTTPCEVALPTINPLHDDSIRASQRTIDSVTALFDRDRLTKEFKAREAATLAAARADSIAKAEAVQLALQRHLSRGMYFGLGGGANAPQRAVRDGYTGGWNVTVPVGFDWTDSPLGVRADFAVDHLNGTRIHNIYEQTLAASGDITVWSLNADMKLRFHAPGTSSRTHLYVLGGAGAHKVSGGVYGTTDPRAGENLTFGNAKTNFGWNVGGGFSASWGPTELFVESRFFQVKSDLAFHQAGGIGTYTSFTPIIVGLQWF
jgi:opacity protein-like surface antigen